MKKTLLILIILLLATACTAQKESTAEQIDPSYPNPSYPDPSYPNQSQTDLPLTEADVPRVTVEEAKFALDNGQAILLDVRSTESYAETHIAGALSFPLDSIEIDPTGLPLDKTQWIITYCT
jgi:3-mercaptopyruvate sulfurtransferase SseA